MGLFSPTKKIYVSSVAYNLAGDVADRPNYLKSLVMTSTLSRAPNLSNDIVGGHLHGPGIQQRSFYRWAKANFAKGNCQGSVNQSVEIPAGPLEDEIPFGVGESIQIQSAFIDTGDIFYWGERWMLQNRPAEYPDDWVAEFDAVTLELVLSFPVGPETRVSYPTFDNKKKYIFAYYTKTLVDTTEVADLFIYELGTGNADLDALDVEISLAPQIFPVIPLRLDNRPVNHSAFAADYPAYSAAYRKTTGSNISDILETIADNESVDDIDYAFLVHGVELNTVENSGRRYLYQFFKSLMPDQKTTPAQFNDWVAAKLGYEESKVVLEGWRDAQSDPLDPLYGTPKPTVPTRAELEITRFSVKTTSSLNYRTDLGWVTMKEDVGSGLGKPGAKLNELWFDLEPDIVVPGVPLETSTWSGNIGEGKITYFKIYWQDSLTAYRVLHIYGMFHENFVYQGKTVMITAREALTEVDPTGFVVPLHYPTLAAMPLVLSTQLSLSSRILVFNCYKVVKTRWYESGLFRFVFGMLLAAAAAVIFPGGIGLLGSNLAVGTSLGFSGTSALIMGGIANALAATVLITVVEQGAVAVFGEELGSIIGAIGSFVVVAFGTGFGKGFGQFNLIEMLKPENLIKLTNAVSGSVTRWAQGRIRSLQEQQADAYEEYLRDSREIEKRRLDELGYGAGVINPLMLLNMADSESTDVFQQESSASFLSRTLLTGSDISRMSISLLLDYPRLSLELPKPFV